MNNFYDLKLSIEKEAKLHDTINKIDEIHYCPDLITAVRCYVDEEERKKIRMTTCLYTTCLSNVIWFFASILGYSSIFESFLAFDKIKIKEKEKYESITLTKNISMENKYRAKYMQYDKIIISDNYVKNVIKEMSFQDEKDNENLLYSKLDE